MSEFVGTCPVCQQIGKPNQSISFSPLVNVHHIQEPFVTIQLDVNSLPRTSKGHEYISTMSDLSARY